MQNLPVHWIEGMFLRPQHFQSADRYWAEMIAASDRLDHSYSWGLQSIELSKEALKNHQVHVIQCRARTRDGAIVDFEAGQGPDRLDLKPAFEKETLVTVYLAVPKLTMGRANLGQRFEETILSVPDESRGGSDQDIQFRALNIRLKLSTDDLQGFETLPIARVKRSGPEETVPTLDDDYIPPVLDVDAWKPLGQDIVRNITDFIGQRIELLSQRAIDRGLTFKSTQAGDLDDLLKLIALNQAYAVLSCVTKASGVHPYTAYRELCRTVGMLSIFGETRRTPDDIPSYDHDDLSRIFKWVDVRIRALIGEGIEPTYYQRFFVGRHLGMRVQIESEWLHSDWKWYVGVRGQNVTEDECSDLLKPGQLDWKMASDSKVDMHFRYAIPDVERVELERPPSALPPLEGWRFYEIRRDSGRAWMDVRNEESLAIRFADHLIENSEQLIGQKRLEIRVPTKKAVLEFALFAVPPRTQT